MGFIYKITNLINQKIYVGQTTKSIEVRFKSHYQNPSRYSLIDKAIKKYGKENFQIELLEEVENEKLNDKEIFYIKELKSKSEFNNYNLTDGGINPPKLKNKQLKRIAKSSSEKRKKTVIRTDLKTGEQKIYNSIKDVELDGFCKQNVGFCCLYPNKRNILKGYKWEFLDKKNIKSYEGYKRRNIKNNPLTIQNLQTNIEISFYSERDAAKYLNCSPGLFSMIKTGRVKTIKGHMIKEILYKEKFKNRSIEHNKDNFIC